MAADLGLKQEVVQQVGQGWFLEHGVEQEGHSACEDLHQVPGILLHDTDHNQVSLLRSSHVHGTEQEGHYAFVKISTKSM